MPLSRIASRTSDQQPVAGSSTGPDTKQWTGQPTASSSSAQQFAPLSNRQSISRASSRATFASTESGAPPSTVARNGHAPSGALPPQQPAPHPSKPLPRIPVAPPSSSAQDFVPAKAESGGRFASFANLLGVNRKGINAVSLASKKPVNNIVSGASADLHGKFAYDSAPATELVNATASGSMAIAAHKVTKRYQNKVDEMLAGDVEKFKAASAAPAQPHDASVANYASLTKEQKQEHAKQKYENQNNPTIPENQLITKDSKGNWQYDKAKLTRIAKDTYHPQSEHARNVLTAMSIAENKGKQRRGAALQTIGSTLGVASTTMQIVGSHGAIAPLLVTGQAGLGGKEVLDMRKPIVEARQEMRNEKSDEVLRHVNQKMSTAGVPHDAPIEAKAGAYAAAYESARRDTGKQRTFGFKISGSRINDKKSAAFKSDSQDLANKHIANLAQTGMNAANGNSLTRLAHVDRETGLTKSQREKRALEHINGDEDLKAVHTLLTDTGISKGDAATLMTKMSQQTMDAKLAAAANPTAASSSSPKKPQTPDEERAKIADIIGEPTLKPADALKDAEGKIKAGLAQRS